MNVPALSLSWCLLNVQQSASAAGPEMNDCWKKYQVIKNLQNTENIFFFQFAAQ